jgi:nucleotide-binding universal stress UspA family protein
MSGILVGVDGSGHSQRALEWAAQEAVLRQVPLTVLTVHQAVVGWAGGPVAFPGDQEETSRARELAVAATEKALGQLGGRRPPEVTVRAVNGLPPEELLRAAEDADLLVMGSRGAGGFSRLLMGSVSSQVTHHARCPIVLIPVDGHH